MWDEPRQLNIVSALLAGVAVALLAWAAIAWIVRQPIFAFREVVVTGPLARANGAHLEAVIRAELAGTFFTMNLDRGRAALARVPWVRKVALRRQWPHRLEVAVEEHVPLARWGEGVLVNTEGEVFAAAYRDALPRFEGPDGTSPEVTRRFRDWGELIGPLGLGITGLKLSARGGWEVDALGEWGPLKLELGRDDPAGRLVRFVAVYPKTIGALGRTGTRVEYVDLRYRNGFAARIPGFREKPARKVA